MGLLCNQFKGAPSDPDRLETEIRALMLDDDVTNKKGISPCVLTRDGRHLNIRASGRRIAAEREIPRLRQAFCL